MNARRRVILFDLGDTLFEPLPRQYGEQNLLAFARQVDVTEPDQVVITTFAETKTAVAQDFAQRSFYTHREFIATSFRLCCDSLGKNGSPVADAYATAQRDSVIAHLAPRSDCFSTLEELNRRGHLLGIVSNIDDDWLTPLIDRWQLRERVDAILSSESAHSCKPDRRIFQLACEQHDCTPDQVVFIGDDETNDIHGAKQAGMTSVLYRDSTKHSATTLADYSIDQLSDVLSLPSLV